MPEPNDNAVSTASLISDEFAIPVEILWVFGSSLLAEYQYTRMRQFYMLVLLSKRNYKRRQRL